MNLTKNGLIDALHKVFGIKCTKKLQPKVQLVPLLENIKKIFSFIKILHLQQDFESDGIFGISRVGLLNKISISCQNYQK